MKQKTVSKRTMTRPMIRAGLRRRGITQDAVAAEAHVTRAFVSSVLSGRFISRPVLDAARRLIRRSRRGWIPPRVAGPRGRGGEQ